MYRYQINFHHLEIQNKNVFSQSALSVKKINLQPQFKYGKNIKNMVGNNYQTQI